MLDTGYKESI